MKKPRIQHLFSLLLALPLISAISRYITIQTKRNATVHLVGSIHFGPEKQEFLSGELSNYPNHAINNIIIQQWAFVQSVSELPFSQYYTETPKLCSYYSEKHDNFFGTESLFCHSFSQQNRTLLWDTSGLESISGQFLLMHNLRVSQYDTSLRSLSQFEVELLMQYPALINKIFNFGLNPFNTAGVLNVIAHISAQLIEYFKPPQARLNGEGRLTRITLLYWCGQCFTAFFNQMVLNNALIEQAKEKLNNAALYSYLFLKNELPENIEYDTSMRTLLQRDHNIAQSIEHILEQTSRENQGIEIIEKIEKSLEPAFLEQIKMQPNPPLTFDQFQRRQEVNQQLISQGYPAISDHSSSAQCPATPDAESPNTLVVVGASHLEGIMSFLGKNPEYDITEHDVSAMIDRKLGYYSAK